MSVVVSTLVTYFFNVSLPSTYTLSYINPLYDNPLLIEYMKVVLV
jgi:hypothetical protein